MKAFGWVVTIVVLAWIALPVAAADEVEAAKDESATATGAPSRAPAADTSTPESVLDEMTRRERRERERRELLEKMALIRHRIRQQLRKNEEWHREALELETGYVREAEEAYDEKRYRRAKRYYMEAVEITYPQWVFTETVIALTRTSRRWHQQEGFVPLLEKRIFHLSTEYTRLALMRLATISTLIAEQDLIRARLRADGSYDQGRLAEAYKRYVEALRIARKMGRNPLAREYMNEMERRRTAILADAAKPLDVVEAALNAGKAGEALAALEEFEKEYMELTVVPALKERYTELEARPEIKQERREQAALKRIARGDAALKRKDYRGAVRWYRQAAIRHPDTKAAELAKQKGKQLLDDPKIVEEIERQEAEWLCKAMTARAQTLAKWGKLNEAVAVYDEIIAKYPETPWAEKAATASEALKAIKPETVPAEEEEEPAAE